MSRPPYAPSGQRFFARIDRFHCECPHCANIILGERKGVSRETFRVQARKRVRRVAQAYNEISSTLRCPYCLRVWQVGLILWPIKLGPQPQGMPKDCKPTRAQMAQLAQYSVGIVAKQRIMKGDSVNVCVTAECTCPMGIGGWDTGCPIHGWDVVRKQWEAEEE